MKWEIIMLMLLLVACAKPAVPASETGTPVPEAPQAEQVATVTAPAAPATDIMGISAAVKLGQPIKCVSEQAGQTATIYMKGSRMRMDTSPADAHGIYTADTMYTWKGTQGMMIKMEDVKKLAETSNQIRPKTQDEIVANAEKSNAKCEPATVDESMFTPPADIQFQDMAAVLKQAEAALQAQQQK